VGNTSLSCEASDRSQFLLDTRNTQDEATVDKFSEEQTVGETTQRDETAMSYLNVEDCLLDHMLG
jgi:hypothetical protein